MSNGVEEADGPMANGAATGQSADLHAHTAASDGTTAPADLPRLARQAGLAAVAVTDHDTCAGYPDALAAGYPIGVRVVPGVELSAVERGRDVHILGYFVSPDDPVFAKRMGDLRALREERIVAMVACLAARGVRITLADVQREAGGGALGRPHVARVLHRLGVVDSVEQAFSLYLGRSGSCFVPKRSPDVREAVGWIAGAGGVAVIAHPTLIRDDSLLDHIVACGARGIEVFHPEHDAAAVARYGRFAKERGLIVTGGSDFHGVGASHRGQLGSIAVAEEVVGRLEEAAVRGRRPGR